MSYQRNRTLHTSIESFVVVVVVFVFKSRNAYLSASCCFLIQMVTFLHVISFLEMEITYYTSKYVITRSMYFTHEKHIKLYYGTTVPVFVFCETSNRVRFTSSLHSAHNTVRYEATNTCTCNIPGCMLLDTNQYV